MAVKITIDDFVNWINDNLGANDSIAVVVNGSGFGYVEKGSEGMQLFLDDICSDDFADEFVKLDKGEEFGDFKDCLTEDEYYGQDFFLLKHHNGYNEENCDIQVGIWDYDNYVKNDKLRESYYDEWMAEQDYDSYIYHVSIKKLGRMPYGDDFKTIEDAEEYILAEVGSHDTAKLYEYDNVIEYYEGTSVGSHSGAKIVYDKIYTADEYYDMYD